MDCVVKHYVVEMNPHRQQGYAFIYFQHPSDALRAVQKFKQRSIDGIYFDCNACFPEASVADGEVATSRTEDERKNIEEKEDRSSSPYPSVPSGNLSMIPSLSHSSEAPINATSTPISSPYIPTLGSQSPQNLSNAHALQPQPLVVNAGIQGHSYLPVSPSLSQSSSHSFSSYHNRSHLHPSHPPATLSSDIGHAPPGSHANSPQMSTNINNSGHPIKGNQSNNPHALRRSQSQQQNHHHHSHNHHHHHQGFSSTVIAPESPMIQTIAAEPYSLPTATSVPFATYVGPSFVQPALAPVYPTTTVSAAQPYYDAYQHAHLMNSAMMPAISTYGVLVPPQQQSSQQQQLYYQSYQSYPVLSHPPVSHQFLPLPQPHSHQMQPQTLPAPGMRASHPMMVNVNTVNQGNRPDPSQFTADRESRTVAGAFPAETGQLYSTNSTIPFVTEINNNNLNSSIAYHPPAITLSNSHPSPSALAQFPHQQSASIVPVSTPLANTDQAYPVNHHHPPYNHNHASQSQQLRRSN